MNNMSNIMKQAKAMQDKMQELQKKVENTEVEGTAGGGLVKITINGTLIKLNQKKISNYKFIYLGKNFNEKYSYTITYSKTPRTFQ